MGSFLKKIRSVLTREVVLYVVFGVLTTLVNYVVFIGLDLLFGEHTVLWSGTLDLLVWRGTASVEFWTLANVVAFVVAVAFAFVTNRNIVFQAGASTGDRKKDRANLARQTVLFWGARLVSLLIEYGILYVLMDRLGVQDFYSKIASNVVVVVVNYFFSKFIIFATPRKDAADPAGG